LRIIPAFLRKWSNRKFVIIAIGFLLFFFLLNSDLVSRFEAAFFQKEDLIHQKNLLLDYYKKIQTRAELEKQYQEAEIRLGKKEEGLFVARTYSLAAADIQKLLKVFIGKSGAERKRMVNLPEEKSVNKHYAPVRIEVTLLAGIRQIVDILYQVHSSEKLLKITKLICNTSLFREKEQFHTTLTIEGLMKKDNASI